MMGQTKGRTLMKPIEFWIALAAAALFVYERAKDKPLGSRVVMVAVSTGLGYSIAPDVSGMSGVSEIISMVLLTTTGYLILDFVSALFSDRDFLKDIIKNRLKK